MQFFSASFEMGMIDAGNMTQWLRALTALAEDLGLIPSPNISDSQLLFASMGNRHTSGTQMYIQAKHTCTYNNIKNFLRIQIFVLVYFLSIISSKLILTEKVLSPWDWEVSQMVGCICSL